MPVQLPKLDDLTYEELVNEAKALIPIIYPEWTDHNPSEPGIMLIELLAWLTEMVIYRTDQVTEDHYRAFINLINPESERTGEEDNLNSKIRDTVVNLNKRYRMVTINDFREFIIEKWPNTTPFSGNGEGDPETQIWDTAKEIEQAGLVSKISRVKLVPNRDYRGHTKKRRRKHAPAHISAVILPEATRQHWVNGQHGQHIYFIRLREPCRVNVNIESANLVDLKIKRPQDFEEIEQEQPDETIVTEVVFEVGETDFDLGDEWGLILTSDANIEINGVITITICSSTGKSDSEVSGDKPPLIILEDRFRISKDKCTISSIVEMNCPGEIKARNRGNNGSLDIKRLGESEYISQPENGNPNQINYVVSKMDIQAGRFWIVSLSCKNNSGVGNSPRNAELSLTYPPVLPSQALTRAIWHYMNNHRLVTTRHHVIGPDFVSMKVKAVLHLRSGYDNTVVADAQKALRDFFDPFVGGEDGEGWPFGRNVYVSEIYEILEGVEGVDYITKVALIVADRGRFEKEKGTLVGVRLEKYELIVVDFDFKDELPELENWDQIKKGWRVEG